MLGSRFLVQAELSGDGDCVVPGDVVDEDDPVDDLVWDVAIGPLERLGGVVGGHDDYDPSARGLSRGRFGRGALVGGRLRPLAWHGDSLP